MPVNNDKSFLADFVSTINAHTVIVYRTRSVTPIHFRFFLRYALRTRADLDFPLPRLLALAKKMLRPFLAP